MSPEREQKPLLIRDEIHGDMVFDHQLRHVIDHEGFQRLRFIKQLGLAEYVFPCANHTRFQHSLGASYLAGQYYQNLLKGWLTSPFLYDDTFERTRFYAKRTFERVREVASDPASEAFWYRVVSLAGMLHDVGHGPWSHTFEYLELSQDFGAVTARMTGTIGSYFKALQASGRRYEHEELSIIYIFQILSDLEAKNLIPSALKYFLPVGMLVNRKMGAGGRQEEMERELESGLKDLGIHGGVDFHRLLRPLISGPFDVDRIDYIQRDGRNCGVSIGGIEWRRIVTKLIPCLADHNGESNEPREVVLLSHIKNQHVLDDFVFSLFQMYAQVYMHPKIVGLEEIIRQLLQKRAASRPPPRITFDRHRTLTDEKFREMLKDEFGVPEANDLLLRRPGGHFQVASFPEDLEMDDSLRRNGFTLIDALDRPMMKDRLGVFLFGGGGQTSFFLRPWARVSPMAEHFNSVHYTPRIWVKADLPS